MKKKDDIKKINKIFSWSDELLKTKFLLRMWKCFSLIQIPLLILIASHNIFLHHSYTKAISEKNDRIILTPAIRSPIQIEYGSSVSNSYILEAARRIVNLQENWSYITIEENYDELIKIHSSFEFENFLKANLAQTGFIEKIKEHKMVSSFRWDENQSKASWCKKLNAACAIIVGNRSVFENGNIPITNQKVGYLIISNAVYPTEERPTALHVNRLIIEDKSDEPFTKLEPLFIAAQKGFLPEGNQHASS